MPARLATGRAGPSSRPPAAMQLQLIRSVEDAMQSLPGDGAGLASGAAGGEGALLSWAANLETEVAKGAEEAAAQVQQQREEQLETACAKMVQKLRPICDEAKTATLTGAEGIAVTAGLCSSEAKTAAKKAAKKEAASWGKGLAKGFLGRPRERRRRIRKADLSADKADKENAATAPPAAPPTAPPAKPRRGDRCTECDVRLPVTAQCQCKCRCGKLYCSAHMHCHTCDFDYRGAMQAKLRQDTPMVAPTKLPSAI